MSVIYRRWDDLERYFLQNVSGWSSSGQAFKEKIRLLVEIYSARACAEKRNLALLLLRGDDAKLVEAADLSPSPSSNEEMRLIFRPNGEISAYCALDAWCGRLAR